MDRLTTEDLYSLEEYSKMRGDFRRRVMQHKENRRLALGPHAALYFEDRLTMQYQIQEMLRVERIFESDEIQSELEAYNPLIPDGTNWKATFMIEYGDPTERRRALAKLVGIERCVWVQVAGEDKVWAIADEDLERATADKTSAVHFLRFELTSAMIAKLRDRAALNIGIDHEHYRHAAEPVPDAIRETLLRDLD